MSLTHDASIIIIALKIFPSQYGLLLGSLSHKSHYDHYGDNIRENAWFDSFWVFLEIAMCALIVVSSGTELCHGTTIILLNTNPILSNIPPF